MKPYPLFFLLSFLLLAAANDTGSKYITADFCAAALGSDLALVTVELMAGNATNTMAKINSLLTGSGGGAIQECLDACLALYNGMIGEVAKAREAINEDYQYNSETMAQLGSATVAPGSSKDGFSKWTMASLLSDKGNYASFLAQLAIQSRSFV